MTAPRNSNAPFILLVEDDLRLSELVSRYLDNHGFAVAIENSGERAVERVLNENPGLVILDLGLPDGDGLQLCKQLRPRYTNPILILTARNDDIDQVLGLELGADDYVIKPVEPRVLMARIHALLRRGRLTPPGDVGVMQFGGLVIKTVSRSVSLDGRAVPLSSNEFDLLVLLASKAGEVQSREDLFQHLYRRAYDGVDRMLDIRISHLRRKLGDDGESSKGIKTIWGQGYLFVPDGW
jgi:DNA-binding response OmpR family regulator